MFNIILFEPEIPPNTGNIIRLCANTGSHLHLIHPLGFSMSDKQMRRAGLDYHQHVTISDYENFADFVQRYHQPIYAIETCGTQIYSDVQFQQGDAFLFGPETRGLPEEVVAQLAPEQILKIPMQANIRSINLSNSVAIVIYEAWRQLSFSS